MPDLSRATDCQDGQSTHGLEKQTVVLRRHPAIGGFAREYILDPFPLVISEQCSGHRVWFLRRKTRLYRLPSIVYRP
jgi:hypothetical protein